MVAVQPLLSRHCTVTVQRLLSNCCCLNCYCPTATVWTVNVQRLLSNRCYIDIELLLSNCCCPIVVVWTVTIQWLLSNHCCLNYYCPTVIVWTLIRFLTISRVLELYFKWDWSHWKAKTRGYKFSKGRKTQFCLQDSQNCSSTHQSYCPTESVTTQSRLVTHNWSSTSPNWARSVSLVS
jgi:hypothetical protein